MSAPAQPYRPSPASIPRRQAAPSVVLPTSGPAAPPYEPKKLTLEESILPGKLRRHEHLRSMYSQGLRISNMRPEARLVALTLLGYANFQTGLIHARHQPAPEQLSYATGLVTARLLVQMRILTERGWLATRTLTDGPRAGETALRLTVPAYVLEQLRARKDAQPKDEPPPAG